MSGARVLITGADGGIGSAAISQLRARGAEVVGLDLVGSEDGSVIACDVTDQDAVDAAVDLNENIAAVGRDFLIVGCAVVVGDGGVSFDFRHGEGWLSEAADG